MNTVFTDAFTALRQSLVDAQISIRIGEQSITTAISSGISKAHESTDQGNYLEADASVRFLIDDIPAEWPPVIEGQKVEISTTPNVWQLCRITSTRRAAGVINCFIVSEVSAR